MRYDHVHLRGFGYVLPERVMTSEAIEELLEPVYRRLKLPPGRLEMMSGIRERRFWEPGTRPSRAAIGAGRAALDRSGTEPREIDCLIFTAVSRDMMEPATAAFVHHGLGLKEECLLFDISNACLGFLDGMVMLANMIELGQIDTGLVVAAETAEELFESTIRALLADENLTRRSIKSTFASLTIGSGAVGLVMSRAPEEGESLPRPGLRPGLRLLGGACQARTDHSNLCQGGQAGANVTLMATDSEALLQKGVETAGAAWGRFLTELGWRAGDVDVFFCHQVGRAHARLLFETLGIDPAANFETLPFLGNVGSVSAPITMAVGIEQGRLAPGQQAALLGIGSGINCLMLGVAW